jgi:hypothetical protein
VNLNKRFLTSHMKGINVPDAADVYTAAIVASCEAHPHRLYITQIFRVTATQSAGHCRKEKNMASVLQCICIIPIDFVFNVVTTCGLWCADVSKQAASIKSGSALVHHNLICHVSRREWRHPNVIRLPKMSFQQRFRRNFRKQQCVEACGTWVRGVTPWVYLQTEPHSWNCV